MIYRDLKNFKNEQNFIDTLHSIHSRLSRGLLYKRSESNENPIDNEEFEDIVAELDILLK